MARTCQEGRGWGLGSPAQGLEEAAVGAIMALLMIPVHSCYCSTSSCMTARQQRWIAAVSVLRPLCAPIRHRSPFSCPAVRLVQLPSRQPQPGEMADKDNWARLCFPQTNTSSFFLGFLLSAWSMNGHHTLPWGSISASSISASSLSAPSSSSASSYLGDISCCLMSPAAPPISRDCCVVIIIITITVTITAIMMMINIVIVMS